MKKKVMKELNSILLRYSEANGMLDWTDINKSIMKTREEILKQHNHSIYQRNDGRWATRLGEGRPYIQIVRVKKEDVEDIVIQHYILQENDNITFEDAFHNWMKHEDNSANSALSPKSLTNYRAEYKRFIFGHPFTKISVQNITERDVQHFLDDVIEREKIKRKRFNAIKTIIAGTISFAKKEYDLDTLPIRTVLHEITYAKSQFVVPEEKRKVFYQDELALLLDHLFNEKSLITLGIILTAQTGLRVSEISALSWDNVFPDKIKIVKGEHTYTKFDGTRVEEVTLPKGMKKRTVLLSDEAKRTLSIIRNIHPTSEGFLFLREDGRRANTRAFDYRIKKACRKCGIKELSMHKLRNTYTSIMLATNTPDILVQQQLGHAQLSTTHNHYYTNPFMPSESSSIFKNKSVLINKDAV